MYILKFVRLDDAYINVTKVDILECRKHLFAKQESSWLETVQNKPKLRFFALFKNTLNAEKYVKINLSSYERSVLVQIRFGILKINVETGRYTNTKLEERLCKVCDRKFKISLILQYESCLLTHTQHY